MVDPGPLADDPRDGTVDKPDLLARKEYVLSIASLLESVRGQSESSVLALIGDWGSGKTSVLEMLRVELGKSGDWSVGTFDPWSYPNAESIQAGFFIELYAALPKGTKSDKLRQSVAGLARMVSPLGALGGLLGADLSGAIQAGADLIGGDTSLDASVRAASADLRSADRPVLMVIDDLDRLTPDELLTVLKLVRHIGRLPHVYYLLGYDEETLLEVLSSTPLVQTNVRAQAYLEKVVQVRLDMPMLRSNEKLALLNNGLDAICAATGVTLTDDDVQRIGRVYEAALERRLSTPRAINRFLGQAQALYAHLSNEVDFVDFLLVSWLRTAEPAVYRMIQQESRQIFGSILNPWDIQRNPVGAALRQDYWLGALERAGVTEQDRGGVATVLGDLFPELEAAFAARDRWIDRKQRERRKGVSERDYFDRYMVFGVPSDDLRDSVVETALSDLARGTTSDSLDQFRSVIVSRTELVLSKIRALRYEAEPLPDFELARFLVEITPEKSQEASLFSDSPDRSIEREIARCLARLDKEQIDTLMDGSMEIDRDGPLLANSVRELLWDDKRDTGLISGGEGRHLEYIFELAAKRLEEAFGKRVRRDIFSASEVAAFLAWNDLNGTATRSWLSRQLSEQVWQISDASASLVLPGRKNAESGVEQVCGGLMSDLLTDVIPAKRLLDDLKENGEHSQFFNKPYPYTAEGRLQFAISELQSLVGDRT